MAKNFYLLKDTDLAVASAQFFSLINAAPTTYGLTAGQSITYGMFNTNFQTALGLALGEATRTRLTRCAARIRSFGVSICSTSAAIWRGR